MSRRRRIPGSSDPRQTRAALRGLDGGPQLRAALDEIRQHAPDPAAVIVDNGGRGPAVIDTRAMPGGWALDGLIPAGTLAALADLDDPSPAALLDGGFDVVLLLELRGAPVLGEPVRVRAYYAARLGLEPPAPFWVRFERGGGLARVDQMEAA